MYRFKDCDIITEHVGILIVLLDYTLFVSLVDFMFLSSSPLLNEDIRVTKSAVMTAFF